MRTCHWVLIGCAIALVLTVGVPSLASATVFFGGSGDVFCLIGSIKSANEGGGADTIILETGKYTFTVADNTVDAEAAASVGGGNALPSITGRVTIQGAGPTETILDGSSLLRLFHIAASGKLTLHGLTIQNGSMFRGDGGAIFNRGTLTVSETVIRDNRSAFSSGGGGIFSVGRLRIVDSRVTNNQTPEGIFGGGILSDGRCTF